MVLIHLAKITLLEKSCEYFGKVIISKKVYEEVIVCKEKTYPDIKIVEELVRMKKIQIIEADEKKYLKLAEEFNIQGGEKEALALYWQEKADYLATDDDNVRKKSTLLNIKIIGTPVIILKLYKEKIIQKEKFAECLNKLKKIGWFSSSIIDKLLMEEK